ncbi:hypothetical protein [Escherichia marmotae]|uniref:hypothetical protein n=1 Tax=Escherichia marmotae TaxID=1499973 RepID=UPI003D96E64C
MESNIKGLVSAGHEMVSELKAECGAVDMRSVAKLISDLATQLEVQLVRANALAAENARLNKFIVQSCYVFNGEQDEISDAYICATDGGMPQIPATDAFLSEVRAQGVEMMREHPSIKLCSLTHICDELAAQLRKGGHQ